MDRFRLLASTGPLFARPLDWAFGVIAEAGYDGVELMVTQDPATQDATRVQAASDAEGISVPCVHGPFLLVTRRVYGTDLIVKARRSLELASALGSDLMIVHPPFRWQRGFHRWLLDEGNDEADALRTRIGVENLYPVAVAGRPVRFHRYTEPEHLQPFEHTVLDTSHFGVARVDIVDAWRALRGNAAHLHISDNKGHGRDSHAALGHGVLPLGQFLHEVGADTYATGSITLELNCRPYLDDRAALVGYLRQERQKCLDLLAGGDIEDVLGRPDRVPWPDETATVGEDSDAMDEAVARAGGGDGAASLH